MALYSDFDELPWLWKPFEHLWFAVGGRGARARWLVAGAARAARLPPADPGPYFALLTQATALVFWLLLVGQLRSPPAPTA